MRDLGSAASHSGAAPLTAPSLEEIEVFTARLAVDALGIDDAQRIDRIAALEALRNATEAAQSETVADFVASQRRAAAERGVPAERRDRGVAEQIALARGVSPLRGRQDVALAMVLRTELQHTRAAFRTGRIDAFRATLIARETACMTAEHRAEIDEQLCADPGTVERLSPRRLVGHLQKAAAALDPGSITERRRRAEADRHTSLRPAPDVMTWFGALLPVKDGVAVHAALEREARRAKAIGDPRSVGQLMADILVQRVVHPADPTHTTRRSTTSTAPVMVNLIVRDAVLLGDQDGPGWVEGHGPLAGDVIREWVADNLQTDVAVWLRRLYEQPTTGSLIAMDSRAVRFQGGLAEFLRLRDRICRTPGCGAPIRHVDHVVARSRGGPTTAENGQGLCELCNYAKEAPGWSTRVIAGPRHTVEITTPTGHRYRSSAERF